MQYMNTIENRQSTGAMKTKDIVVATALNKRSCLHRLTREGSGPSLCLLWLMVRDVDCSSCMCDVNDCNRDRVMNFPQPKLRLYF